MHLQSNFHKFLLGIFLIVCQMGQAMAFTGPYADSLKPVLFDLSGRQITVPLPTKGLSKDLDRTPFVTNADLDQLPPQGPVMLVDELWDWSGFFWQGVRGSVAIKVSVDNAPSGISLHCEESVRQMLTDQFKREKDEFFRLGGQPKYMSNYLLDPHPHLIDGIPALYFGERGRYTADFYVMPVTDRAYVRLGFIFLRNSDDQNWLTDAMALEKAILDKIRFGGPWMRMESCPVDPPRQN